LSTYAKLFNCNIRDIHIDEADIIAGFP